MTFLAFCTEFYDNSMFKHTKHFSNDRKNWLYIKKLFRYLIW